jgi:hypothetical protein
MFMKSAKSNAHDFQSKNFNHAFIPKSEFESYRNDVKINTKRIIIR